MKESGKRKLYRISGAMNLDGLRESLNVTDFRGTDMGSWIDAANACWMSGTSSGVMYPGGVYIPDFSF
ncbi:hypothetical protein ABW286_07080 [Erwinia papayae]|uniref:Uncharacterized protein n=1 Tax=Erwinia papayae TaxID=206499 RepID=A0ABV3MZF2_9GAMM